MKKTMLYTALFAAMYTVSYADNPVATSPTTTTPTAVTTTAAPTNSAVTTPQTSPSSIPTPQAAPVIDCKYRIPAETATIENPLISTWASKATVQSFSFTPATIDNDLTTLKPCYTEQGWQGFNDALQKSGNIEAIKSQHLTVSSQIDGDVAVAAVKDNQWKVTVPLQVVYQNEKEKLTQVLTVDLLIGRKISGDLGIMQMIATPRQNNTGNTTLPTDTTTTGTTPSNSMGTSPASTTAPGTNTTTPNPDNNGGTPTTAPATSTPPQTTTTTPGT